MFELNYDNMDLYEALALFMNVDTKASITILATKAYKYGLRNYNEIFGGT